MVAGKETFVEQQKSTWLGKSGWVAGFSFLVSLGASAERSKAFTLMMTGCHSSSSSSSRKREIRDDGLCSPHLRLLTCHRDRSRATVTAASSNHSNHQVNDLIEELLLQLCTRRLLDNHLYSSSSHGTIIWRLSDSHCPNYNFSILFKLTLVSKMTSVFF